MKSISNQLNQDLNKVDTNLNDLQSRLKPVTLMNETVGLCKTNISEAHKRIKGTCDALTQAEDAIQAMQR